MNPSTQDILRGCVENLEELVMPEVTSPHAKSALMCVRMLINHAIVRIEAEGEWLAGDCREKRELLSKLAKAGELPAPLVAEVATLAGDPEPEHTPLAALTSRDDAWKRLFERAPRIDRDHRAAVIRRAAHVADRRAFGRGRFARLPQQLRRGPAAEQRRLRAARTPRGRRNRAQRNPGARNPAALQRDRRGHAHHRQIHRLSRAVLDVGRAEAAIEVRRNADRGQQFVASEDRAAGASEKRVERDRPLAMWRGNAHGRIKRQEDGRRVSRGRRAADIAGQRGEVANLDGGEG